METSLVDKEEGSPSHRGSRATSPGGCWRESNNSRYIEVSGLREGAGVQDEDYSTVAMAVALQKPSRYRPRTFPYQRYLPYSHNDRQYDNLEKCIRQLYVAVSAGDFVPGATHWTRELKGWLQLKFNLPREDRVRLTKLYYELALAPGMDKNAAERFASMFTTLTKRKHYLRVGEDLYLDWRPLYNELKHLVLPMDTASVISTSSSHARLSPRFLMKLCSNVQLYVDPKQIPEILNEVLPYFSASSMETAFAVTGILNLMLPTVPSADPEWHPQRIFPSVFHLWSLCSRSRVMDLHMIDLISRFARDGLVSDQVEYSEYGLLTREQTATIFTAALRLLEIPVSQVSSPYSNIVDMYQGSSAILDRDQRKQPMAHHVARWIVMSLSPDVLSKQDSILSKLEGLLQAVETFFHPSNSGHWTRNLSQLIFYLSDFFVMRWNRERSGEMRVPEHRKLTEAVRRRFVACLREVTFIGIFAKSSTAIAYSLSSLQSLAYLEPELILPGSLQRIYPAMRGLVEVHRTTSSLRALFHLTRVLCRTKGFRCHVPALLGLALPGIDANDLDKTLHTLSFMQSVFYEIPMADLTTPPQGVDEPKLEGMLAAEWVTQQIERFELEGVSLKVDYNAELSDEDERTIVRSSTAEFKRFVSSLLDSVFNLLRNLPDATRIKTGSPEDSITNALPNALTPLLASMSPEIYDLVLEKLVEFLSQQTVHQARDAVAFLCSTVCKANPRKALSLLLPILTQNIRNEINDNGAGSTRTVGSDPMPRDKALVYNIHILGMSIVHTGSVLVDFRKQLLDITRFMHEKCKGIPSTHASNVLHHLLVTLTMTYTVDHSLFEEEDVKDGITADDWGVRPDPRRLSIKWHFADQRETEFAIEVFKEFAEYELGRLSSMTSAQPPVRRDGSGKEWSDEVSRSLVLLRLLISGIAPLFDARHDRGTQSQVGHDVDDTASDVDVNENTDDDVPTDADFGATEDEDIRPTFQYPTGYQLQPGDPQYKTLHMIRDQIGTSLHAIHQFLKQRQQDDVTSFNALYAAYKCWFVDVGFERSAHVLDRMTRLLSGDIAPFKFSGLRKEYPRPLLVRRAYLYHLQRLRHNASPRHKSDLDVALLRDLVDSSVSTYTDIRKTAQTAIESSMKVLIGARPVIIPPLLETFEQAVKENDFARIKGCMYALLFGSLVKPVGRDWRFTPSVMKSYVRVMDVDRPSVQKIASAAAIQMMDMTRQFGRTVVLDPDVTKTIQPLHKLEKSETLVKRRHRAIKKRFDFVKRRRFELADELAQVAQKSHWKKEARTASLVIGLSLSFDSITTDAMIDLVVKRSIDTHPSLRMSYQSGLIGLFTYVDMRASASHKYENFLLNKLSVPGLVKEEVDHSDPAFTQKYLDNFAQPEAKTYVDQDYPGWLVWGKSIPSFKAAESCELEYDEVEKHVRARIGKLIDREWITKFFSFLKQEPRDSSLDRFRMTNVLMLAFILEYILTGEAAATLQDIRDLVQDVFGDGSDKHQHRATAEILASLLSAVGTLKLSMREEVWAFVFPIARRIFEDGLTPENSSYWQSFLDVAIQNKDPRRCWPLVDWLASFRLDMSSNAAFKESSKIILLEHCIYDLGWHFRLADPILQDFLAHLDHPYKGVREVMGTTISSIYRTGYYESHSSTAKFLAHEASTSALGSRPYAPSDEFTQTIDKVFKQIEEWRLARPAGQQTASSYTSGAKTVLAWIESTLQSYDCIRLVPFFHSHFLPALLHMMDIKEDPELQAQAYTVFRHLGNIPFRIGEEAPFVAKCIEIGRTSSSWHQRLRVMINMQAIYFRQLFLMPSSRQRDLFDAVASMLEDSQLEVRVGASTTLSGMIRCSPVSLRSDVIKDLTPRFTSVLSTVHLPKKMPNGAAAALRPAGTPSESGRSTPSSTGTNEALIKRHAAVLGLGALVQAFPYTSPPPEWVPGVLATLATKAAGEPGIIGQSAKSIVSDFKKTRQDTWHIDVKAFQQEQLEDLEGVLWKSYFA
ncbi:MAG: hypothetical protein Q9159_001870 [Coniocarpon cinnabarinum]